MAVHKHEVRRLEVETVFKEEWNEERILIKILKK